MVRIRRDEVGQPAYEILENRAWDHLTWDDTLASLANSADAVCFGTLGQRHAPARSTIRKFLACCRGRIILDFNLRPPHDATPLLMESLALAQVLKFNDAECAELSRRRNRDHVGETDFVLQLFREYESLEVIIVTAGAAGCRIYPRESAKPISIPAEPLQAGDLVDPVGAGDAFTAAWIVNHLQGRDLLEAGRRANHGGAPILALLE
jgi:fructokinase